MSFKGSDKCRPCPECSGVGIHNNGDEYASCWRCCGTGLLEDDSEEDMVVVDDSSISLTEDVNVLFVEDTDEETN